MFGCPSWKAASSPCFSVHSPCFSGTGEVIAGYLKGCYCWGIILPHMRVNNRQGRMAAEPREECKHRAKQTAGTCKNIFGKSTAVHVFLVGNNICVGNRARVSLICHSGPLSDFPRAERERKKCHEGNTGERRGTRPGWPPVPCPVA